MKIFEISTEGFNTLIERQAVKQDCDMEDMEGMFKQREEYEVEEGVAYISVFGPLARNTSKLDQMTGMTDYEQIMEELEMAQNDISVSTVVLNFDSPGGESIGSQEVAEMVETFPKMIVGVVKGVCMSAALKIGVACSYLVASVSSEIGSIGSIVVLTNSKAMMNASGITKDIFYNTGADYKSIAQDFGDTTDDQKAFIQLKVDKSGERFQQMVIRNRPSISPEVFTAAYYTAEEALAVGLIDGII